MELEGNTHRIRMETPDGKVISDIIFNIPFETETPNGYSFIMTKSTGDWCDEFHFNYNKTDKIRIKTIGDYIYADCEKECDESGNHLESHQNSDSLSPSDHNKPLYLAY